MNFKMDKTVIDYLYSLGHQDWQIKVITNWTSEIDYGVITPDEIESFLKKIRLGLIVASPQYANRNFFTRFWSGAYRHIDLLSNETFEKIISKPEKMNLLLDCGSSLTRGLKELEIPLFITRHDRTPSASATSRFIKHIRLYTSINETFKDEKDDTTNRGRGRVQVPRPSRRTKKEATRKV
jgi:hypothetical protein